MATLGQIHVCALEIRKTSRRKGRQALNSRWQAPCQEGTTPTQLLKVMRALAACEGSQHNPFPQLLDTCDCAFQVNVKPYLSCIVYLVCFAWLRLGCVACLFDC